MVALAPFSRLSRGATQRQEKKKNCGIFACFANLMSELAVSVARTFPPLKRNGDAAASSSFCRRWVHLCTRGGEDRPTLQHTNTAPFSSSSGNSRVFGKRRRRRRRVVEWGAGGWAFCCHHYNGGGGWGGGEGFSAKKCIVLHHCTLYVLSP